MGLKPSPSGETLRFLYFAASSGKVTDEAIMEYIRGQDGTEPSDGDDNFQVTPS